MEKSAEHHLAAFGLPEAFHYQMMRGCEVIDAGTSNCLRRFKAQVTFPYAQVSHQSMTPSPHALPALMPYPPAKTRAKRRTEGCSASLASPIAGEPLVPTHLNLSSPSKNQ